MILSLKKKMKKNNKFSQKFSTKGNNYVQRDKPFLDEKIKEKDKFIIFSFKDFDHTQPINSPETFQIWEKEQLLSQFNEKLVFLSDKTIAQALSEKIITTYDSFPPNSDFTHPKHINEDVKWARIEKISGQKARVAGYIENNVFYIVFLDKEHKFWKTEKKNT